MQDGSPREIQGLAALQIHGAFVVFARRVVADVFTVRVRYVLFRKACEEMYGPFFLSVEGDGVVSGLRQREGDAVPADLRHDPRGRRKDFRALRGKTHLQDDHDRAVEIEDRHRRPRLQRRRRRIRMGMRYVGLVDRCFLPVHLERHRGGKHQIHRTDQFGAGRHVLFASGPHAHRRIPDRKLRGADPADLRGFSGAAYKPGRPQRQKGRRDEPSEYPFVHRVALLFRIYGTPVRASRNSSG